MAPLQYTQAVWDANASSPHDAHWCRRVSSSAVLGSTSNEERQGTRHNATRGTPAAYTVAAGALVCASTAGLDRAPHLVVGGNRLLSMLVAAAMPPTQRCCTRRRAQSWHYFGSAARLCRFGQLIIKYSNLK